MNAKKRTMIRKYAENSVLQWNSFFFLVLAGVEVWFAYFISRFDVWAGFVSGLVAFGVAFLGIEVLAGKVFKTGSVRGGVVDGVVWVFLKFLGPLAVIGFAVARGFSVGALFFGLVVGLVNISIILWGRARFGAEND